MHNSKDKKKGMIKMKDQSVFRSIMRAVKIVGVIFLGFCILHFFTTHSQEQVNSEGKE